MAALAGTGGAASRTARASSATLASAAGRASWCSRLGCAAPILALHRHQSLGVPVVEPTISPRQGVISRGFLDNLFGGGDKSADLRQEPQAEIIAPEDLPFPIDLLDDTFLRGRDLARAYKASEDGFDALVFHQKADMKGPCMVYAETVDGIRFGGFNTEGFTSSDDYAASFKAFLYCWPEEHMAIAKVGGPEAAVFDYARGGPQWGADGLIIGPPAAPVMGGMAGPDGMVDGAGSLRSAKSRLGQAYEMIPEQFGQRSLFGKSNAVEATLREVEVYYAPEIAKMY